MAGKPRRIITVGFVVSLGFLFVALLRLAIALWQRRRDSAAAL